ncbi:unnamed protein product [Cercopithifilaria johnstoni]|uniref:C2 domain-containing protein n=1 Tax=Cercopithifilaria johnstoni TaxID=2874296 RepID=A0A8J2QAG1_9BILA|nr:unnamed protein product [Cercopithifilaria johnstoni]
MVIRPSIEKWSRQELEDRYHVLYQENHSLKRNYNELETKLKQSNAKIKRMIVYGKDCNDDLNYAELIKENRLLTNKLKNLKQQILNYARPGTSVQCSLSSQARSPVQRPQSALPQRPYLPRHTTSNSSTQFANVQQRPATDVPKISDRKSVLLDKTLFVKLNRELKQKDDECALLTCKLNNVQQQLEKLKNEYDQVLEQLQSKQYEGFKLQRQFDETTTIDTMDAKQLKNVYILKKEMEMIQEENKMLHEANEKLIQNSLTIERLTTEEGKYRGAIDDQRVLEMEKQLNELFAKYSQLKQNYRNLMQTKLELEERLSHQSAQIIKEKTVIDGIAERKNEFEKRKMEFSEGNEKFNKTDFSLVKIYEDLTRIIEAHIVERSSDDDDDNGTTTEREEHIDKWRMMYMEIYGELEKVRNMLLIQHNINEQHLQEIALLNQNLQQTKAHSECKMKDLVMKLTEREAEITNLEMRLKMLAYDDQMIIPRATTNKQEMETNELMLHLSRIVLTSHGLSKIGTVRPIIFLAIEFYDFELQTTPMLNGPEIQLDFSTIYDVIVSNLFLHYLETHGITVEMYHPRGADYVLCSVGIISLKYLTNATESYRGILQMRSSLDGCLFATIEYDITINTKMINALVLQKKKINVVSSGALTDTDESINRSMYNMLIVHVQRCNNLDKLINENYAPTTLIFYELYDCDVWRTEPVSNNTNPEYNSVKTWILPVGIDLYNVLRSSHLTITVLEKQIRSGDERQIGYVNIALYPLVHNNEISGTFPLHSAIKDVPTEASIDISIRWKFPYHPPESELKLAHTDEDFKRSVKTIDILPEGKLVNKRMKSKEQSSIVNDEFVNVEAENFRFHLDFKNDVERIKPKAVDILGDMENDNGNKLDNFKNQSVNMDEMNKQYKSSILSQKGRKIPHVVEFADPIQQSFSASVSSTDETTNSWTTDEGQIIEDDIPIISAKCGQLNGKFSFINNANFDKFLQNNAYTVEIIIGSLRISDLSKLVNPLYDDQSITIEWKFLDFPLEECETIGEPLPLPRDIQTTADFNFQKSYTLNDRQYHLLRQWIEHGNRMEINLVSNGSNLKSSEDLGVAYAELGAQHNAVKRLIRFVDINDVEVANIDISISYSKELLEKLQDIGKGLEDE